jgi:AraC family transcriptional regulator of adaptative response/methylated-DNA-[protein]-cysteine methyltransferase
MTVHAPIIAAGQPAAAGAVHFVVVPSSLGHLLVARGERGVAAVLLGDDPDALAADVRRRLPGATPGVADDQALHALADRVRDAVERGTPGTDLPLDLRGTAFQQAVWQALREIPAGSTATYTDIAHRIGRPASVRAVAQACAANAVAVIVPCHRVVRRDGGLSGYRWGVERKRLLLAREAAGEAVR